MVGGNNGELNQVYIGPGKAREQIRRTLNQDLIENSIFGDFFANQT